MGDLGNTLLYGIWFIGAGVAITIGNTTRNYGVAWLIVIGTFIGGLVIGIIADKIDDAYFKKKMVAKEKYGKVHAFEIAKKRFMQKSWWFDAESYKNTQRMLKSRTTALRGAPSREQKNAYVDWDKYREIERELWYLDNSDRENEMEVIIYLLRGDDEYVEKYIDKYEHEFSVMFNDEEKEQLKNIISVKNEQKYKDYKETIKRNKNNKLKNIEDKTNYSSVDNGIDIERQVLRKTKSKWLNNTSEFKKHNLIKIDDNTDFGFCLDLYTYGSIKLNDEQFKNEYSKLGQMIHDLKYSDLSNEKKIDLINNKIVPEIIARTKDLPLWDMDIAIIPMPFSKERTLQPVYELARAISDKKQKPILTDVLRKNNNVEAKKTTDEFKDGVFTATYSGKPTSVLIIDDTYGRGRSLRASVKALRKNPKIENIYYMGIVKNRNGGLTG